ncbi:MAG: hypothetical protein ACRDMA_02145 [Solirubrobacterales bacterium]
MNSDTLQAIADANFDRWNDLPFPDLPPIHPADDSQHQTAAEVIEAWHATIDSAATIAGSHEAAIELYRACRQTEADKILAKAERAKHPPNYVRTSMRNHKRRMAKQAAKRAEAKAEAAPEAPNGSGFDPINRRKFEWMMDVVRKRGLDSADTGAIVDTLKEQIADVTQADLIAVLRKLQDGIDPPLTDPRPEQTDGCPYRQ